MEREEPGLAWAVRKAFLRGACLALVLVVPGAALGVVLDGGRQSLLAGAFGGFAVGFFTGPSTIVEILASRRPPSRRRDLVAAAVTTVLAGAALILAILQTTFTLAVLEHGSVASAMREVDWDLAHGLGAAPFLWTLTLPFVSSAVGRLHGRTLPKEAAAGALCGVVAIVPSLVGTAALALLDRWAFLVAVGVPVANVLAVLLLSGACRLADRADGLLLARLEGGR